MVEFRFDISPLFSQPIVKVTSNLLPHTFRGDRRQCLDATSKMSEIIDRLGQLSANAQKLNTPVTTAQRLRMSENQTIYLLADVNAGNNGAVIGLLKVGTKDLYLFDETGQTRKVENAPCILDFYIHESRQRAGLGKDLFETMLADEKWTPIKCSVDRPSEKLLGFLRKHYGLVRSIPQSNNFVLYEGFFDDDDYNVKHTTNGGGGGGNGMYITNSPNTQLFGATYLGDENNKRRSQRHLEAASNMTSQITQISPVGRYGARRPTCSMAERKHLKKIMDSKRGGQMPNASRITHHPQTAEHQRMGVSKSKTKLLKNSSEISLTPSQLAEEAKVVARKNPLDALSKTNVRQSTMERRSGLQDVDEEYLKQNVFRKPQFQRNSGLNEMNSFQQQIANPSHAAGQPSISHGEQAQLQQQHSHPPTQQQQQQINQQQSPSTVVTNQNASQITVGQPTSAAGSLPAESKININQAPMSMGQQQQQQQQVPSMMTSTMSQQQVPVPHHHHHHHQQHHQHQQHSGQHLHHRQHEHHHQTPSAMPTPTIVQSVMPEPEMCTTCPNCQTTIYLVPAPATLGHSQQTTYESSSSAAAAQPEIIHSGTTPTKGAESGSDQQTKVDFVLENLQNLQIEDNNETSAPAEPELPQNEPNDIEEDLQTQPDVDVEPEVSTDLETNTNTTNMDHATEQEPSNSQQNSSSVAQSPSEENHKPAPTFHLSKQHTGMKNRSYGVGMAVTPTNKMEFDQESREDFGVVKINRPVGSKCAMSPSGSHPGGDDAMSTVSSGGEGLTDQGYNDLKFYHNKLW